MAENDVITTIAKHIREQFNNRVHLSYGRAPLTTHMPYRTTYANAVWIGTDSDSICSLSVEGESLIVTCCQYKTMDGRDVHTVVSLADPDCLERLINAIKSRLYSGDWPKDYMTSRLSTERR